MRSAKRRTSFAFSSVVLMRSWLNSSATRVRYSEARCAGVRPSFRPAFKCRMVPSRASGGLLLAHHAPPLELLARREVLEPHAERQTHLGEQLLDLVERLAAEVLGLEHLGFGLL